MKKEPSKEVTPQLPKLFTLGACLFLSSLVLLLVPVTSLVSKKMLEIHSLNVALFLTYGLTFFFLGFCVMSLAHNPRKFCSYMSKKNIKPVSSAVFCISVLLTFTLTEGYIDDSTWETFDASFYLFLIPALIAFFVCAAIIFRYQAIFENEKKLPKEE